MSNGNNKENSNGTAEDVVQDIDIAIDYIRNSTKITKINIIGHSWGATVSGLYAALNSEKIDKLVLFAPFIQRSGKTEWNKPKELYEDLTPNERIEQFISKIPKGKDMTLEKDVIENRGKEWLESDPTSKSRIPPSVRFPSAWQVDLFIVGMGNVYLIRQKLKIQLCLLGENGTLHLVMRMLTICSNN